LQIFPEIIAKIQSAGGNLVLKVKTAAWPHKLKTDQRAVWVNRGLFKSMS